MPLQLFYRVAGSKKLQRIDIIGKDTIDTTILTSYHENEPANSVIQLAAMFCKKKKKLPDAAAPTEKKLEDVDNLGPFELPDVKSEEQPDAPKQ